MLENMTRLFVFAAVFLAQDVYAQQECPASLAHGTRIRLTVAARQPPNAIGRVASCTASQVSITDRSGQLLSIEWNDVARLERARRRDFRWPGLVAGTALGVWLGLKLPEGAETCDEIGGLFQCREETAVDRMFLGVATGMVGGFFGGMLIGRTSWELVPLAPPRSLGMRIRF